MILRFIYLFLWTQIYFLAGVPFALGAGDGDPVQCFLLDNAKDASETKLPDIEGVEGAVLRIGNSYKTMPATNFYYRGKAVVERFGTLVRLLFSRTADAIAQLNQRMTTRLGELGMDFLVKDERGYYNKRHQVPVHATVLPMDAGYYRDLNRSTEPYLRATRAFLQAYFSSGEKPTADEIMARGKLPKEARPQVEELLKIVNESIYQLPGLHGSNMENYPILAGPVGFDAVLADMERAQGIFFEPNKGTPSGITNLTKLLELLREVDPEQFKIIATSMVENQTFRLFRQAIESGAKEWTGRDGISVVVGPGEYNGAHPDVASIAILTGMPLVKPGELYRGRDGQIRWNTGEGKEHPVVTGIYSRMEESFILQEGSDLRQGGSPLIQTFVDNLELNQRLGLNLKQGVWYDYIYQDNDVSKPIVGVSTDSQGNPVISQSIAPVLGPSPDGQPSGTLRQAILDRKIFLNNLGGRLVDNKRAFTLLHQIGQYYRSDVSLPVAGPPPSLPRERWASEFLPKFDSDQWVVKVDDSSGGDGVYIFANLNGAERKKVADYIRSSLAGKSTRNFEIQYFTTSASQVSTRDRGDGTHEFSNRVVDLRIFPFFFADGHVDSGPTAALVRTAPQYSAKANTSAGGGYGILAVLDRKALNLPPDKILPPPARQFSVGKISAQELRKFVRSLSLLVELSAKGPGAVESFDLKAFAVEGKRVMHLLGWEYSVIRVRAEQYAQREIEFQTFARDVTDGYERLHATSRAGDDRFTADGVKDILESELP